MGLWYARAPVPDAAYWPGRRLLAVADALAWPALLAALVTAAPIDTGILGPTVVAACALVGVRRCVRAWRRHDRYRLTTWRLGVPLAALIVLGGA